MSNPTDAEKTHCLKAAAAVATRHVSPAALDAATADIARWLEKERVQAAERALELHGAAPARAQVLGRLAQIDQATLDGACRATTTASAAALKRGDVELSLAMLAVHGLVHILEAVMGFDGQEEKKAPEQGQCPPC